MVAGKIVVGTHVRTEKGKLWSSFASSNLEKVLSKEESLESLYSRKSTSRHMKIFLIVL